jgi:hypothetical protein
MSSRQNPSRRAFLTGVALAVPASSIAVSSAAVMLLAPNPSHGARPERGSGAQSRRQAVAVGR